MSLEAWGDDDVYDSWADRAMDAGWFDPTVYSPGAIAILKERERQAAGEGFAVERDDSYMRGELIAAAMSYAGEAGSIIWGPDGIGDCPVPGWAPEEWPWDPTWWKPSADPIRNLERAGALIAAEIDRLKRKAEADSAEPV